MGWTKEARYIYQKRGVWYFFRRAPSIKSQKSTNSCYVVTLQIQRRDK